MLPLHKTTYFYTPQAYTDSFLPEVTIVFTTLSLADINSLNYLYESGQPKEYAYRTCELAIQRIETVGNEVISLSTLPTSLINAVADEIIKKSTVTSDILDKVNSNLEIYFSPQLSSDNWKCDTCKKKKLDRVRNCGFKGEQNKNSDFKIMVGDKLYTHCPIFDVDISVISTAIESYNIFKAGFLPSDGGWYNQTQAFCIISVLTNNKIEERNKAEMDKMMKESKSRK